MRPSRRAFRARPGAAGARGLEVEYASRSDSVRGGDRGLCRGRRRPSRQECFGDGVGPGFGCCDARAGRQGTGGRGQDRDRRDARAAAHHRADRARQDARRCARHERGCRSAGRGSARRRNAPASPRRRRSRKAQAAAPRSRSSPAPRRRPHRPRRPPAPAIRMRSASPARSRSTPPAARASASSTSRAMTSCATAKSC